MSSSCGCRRREDVGDVGGADGGVVVVHVAGDGDASVAVDGQVVGDRQRAADRAARPVAAIEPDGAVEARVEGDGVGAGICVGEGDRLAERGQPVEGIDHVVERGDDDAPPPGLERAKVGDVGAVIGDARNIVRASPRASVAGARAYRRRHRAPDWSWTVLERDRSGPARHCRRARRAATPPPMSTGRRKTAPRGGVRHRPQAAADNTLVPTMLPPAELGVPRVQSRRRRSHRCRARSSW